MSDVGHPRTTPPLKREAWSPSKADLIPPPQEKSSLGPHLPKARSRDKGPSCYLDGKREEIDLLQRFDLHIFDQAAQLGDRDPLQGEKAPVTRAACQAPSTGPSHAVGPDLPLCPRPCLRELRGHGPDPDPGRGPDPGRRCQSLHGSCRGLRLRGPRGPRAPPQHRRHPPFAEKEDKNQ